MTVLAWWFADNGYGFPKGIIHVGANNGYEIEEYLTKTKNIVAIEPLPNRFEELVEKYEDRGVICINCALGEKDEIVEFNVTKEDDEKSSLLLVDWPEFTVEKIQVQMHRFDTMAKNASLELEKYDTLVIDPQGTELQVLKGFGDLLQNFKYLMVEVTDDYLIGQIGYVGLTPSSEVINFLKDQGFAQVSPNCGHCDIAFVRRDCYLQREE